MRLVVLALAIALSGCTTPAELGEYTLSVEDAPTTATGPFTFHLHIDGDVTATSDHIGAHFWNSSTADPDAAFGDAGACAHVAGDAPGEFDVTCNLENGTWYVRGHMRLEQEETVNHWSDEFTVVVARE